MASDPAFASRLVLLPFNGNIVDKKGAAWTTVGGIPTYGTGVYAGTQAVTGAPGGSRVQAPGAAQATFGSANVAFEFWFKGSVGLLKAAFMVFSSRNAAGTQGIRFFVNAALLDPDIGTLQFEAPQIGVSAKASGFNLLDGAWHFVQIIRVGSTSFNIRMGNVGDATTTSYYSTPIIGSLSNTGFVAPAIGQEPTPATFSPLEGLQDFRITTGALVTALPIAVPVAPWPDGPAVAVTGQGATYAFGTVAAVGAGKGFTSGRAGTYARGAVAVAGAAAGAPSGQGAAYVTGSPVGACAAAGGPIGQAGACSVGVLIAAGAALAAGSSQAGTYALDASAAGAAAIAVPGVGATWAQGVAAGAAPGNASAAGVAATWAPSGASAAGGSACAMDGVAMDCARGALRALGDADATPQGAPSTWAPGALFALGDADAAPSGRMASYALGDVAESVSGNASPASAASAWSGGVVTASVPGAPSVCWTGCAEVRRALPDGEFRIATIPGERRTFEVTR